MNVEMSTDIAALLRDRGWQVSARNPGGADLWAFERAEMYLPPIVRRGSFEWSDITERIASAHQESVITVERALEFVRFDITRFRIDNDVYGAQTIALEAGATVIGSAFGMIRAAATTARRPRQSIGSNYSKLGDDIAREARLAHTEVGSFVFPVLLRVGDPKAELEPHLTGVTFDSVQPESEERRVTRTLAQALAAYDKNVIQPAREPQSRDLLPVVIAGGSKEIFAQVNRTLSEPGVSWLSTEFTWAPAEAVAAAQPRAVTIPAEAREIVAKTVRLLSSPKQDPLRVITGPIIHIGHVPGDPFGEIAIQTPSPTGARVGRVDVRVRQEQLTEIHQWMDEGTTVVVHGVVERRHGRTARLREIASPRPLEDTLADFDTA
ncbi:hypothetical protein J7E25_05445 [Agromyces sp. ISL-38]|uniref:hypothetical protein n=1 Tax=Agromyces sp. ISL-38 TaxID=2819107 RepID=UPI001BE8438C|nr:hypothetical protein [Agromyces sp. ISL-38]MBT2498533.1 hypothetical protein [Agromyces sp. ISL-38]